MSSVEQDQLMKIVSVDDHLVEPPQLWTDRLPARYLDRGPSCVRTKVLADITNDDQGERDLFTFGPTDPTMWCDVWYFEDEKYLLNRVAATVGFDNDELERYPTTYDEIGDGCFKWDARLEAMDIAGVEASLTFPNLFVQFCGQRFLRAKDKELGLLSIRAYNDFLFEEWEQPSRGRLRGSAILPLWDVDLAVAEVERIAARGCRSICFSEIPGRLGLPSMYGGKWDKLFAACESNEVVISVHVGSSSTITVTPDAPVSVGQLNFFGHTSLSMTDWIMSGAFVKFPNLKVAFAEGQAGWVPYLLERMDSMWDSKKVNYEICELPERPSHYMKNLYFCVYDDVIGLSHLDIIGETNVCFETDYPHPDGTFPNSAAVAMANTAMVDDRQRRMILRDNAINLYGFDLLVDAGTTGN